MAASRRIQLFGVGSVVGGGGPALPSYLYAGLQQGVSPAKIVKVDLSTFSRVGVLDIASGTGTYWTVVTALPGAAKLYAGFFGYPNKIGKVDLATFALDGGLLTLNAGEEELYPDKTMVIVGDYLYVACGSGGKIVKVDTTTLTRIGRIDYAPAEFYALATDQSYLYGPDYTTFPGQVNKARISDFTHISTLTLNPGEDYTRAAAVDAAKTYLYTGHFLSPGKITKVDLSTFTRTAGLTLGGGENNLRPLFIIGGYLYAGLGTSPGKIVKIDLSTFTEVSTLTFAAGENNVIALVGYGNFLYAGLGTSPGKIVKIDLSTFTEVSTLTLIAGEGYVISLIGV